jgi:thymidine phosphorylase
MSEPAAKKATQSYPIPALIAKKRDGKELTDDELAFFVRGVVDKSIPMEQIGAMLMAIYLKGMGTSETVTLTRELTYSGETLSWPDSIAKKVVDKHSTGGVGDKISLPLAPALAACGLHVPMISGRGLGHTGGTLDKLEAIPGFSVMQPSEKIASMMTSVGCCIVGQTEQLVPADRVLYAIRDITSTVESIPLITASIVSKKVAEGLSSLVLDVKVGRAAFMKTEEAARELAQSMVNAGNGAGVKTVAVLTRMEYPIGRLIGNSTEIAESVYCMQGKGPADLEELVCAEGGYLLFANGQAASVESGVAQIKEKLHDGSALEKFRLMCIAQGVTEAHATSLVADPWTVLPKAAHSTDIKVPTVGGYICDIDAMALAITICLMGAGRQRKEDKINYGVGLEIVKHIGEKVEANETWLRVLHDAPLSDAQLGAFANAVKVQEQPFAVPSLIVDAILPSTL